MPSGSARVASTARVCGWRVGVDDEAVRRRLRRRGAPASSPRRPRWPRRAGSRRRSAAPVRSVDHRLEVQQRLEPALADLRLVRRVRRVPGRVLEHVAPDHRRREGVVVAQADHRARPPCCGRPARAARRAPRPRCRPPAGRGPSVHRIAAGTAAAARSSRDAVADDARACARTPSASGPDVAVDEGGAGVQRRGGRRGAVVTAVSGTAGSRVTASGARRRPRAARAVASPSVPARSARLRASRPCAASGLHRRRGASRSRFPEAPCPGGPCA